MIKPIALRNYYLQTKRYMELFPKDLVAKEAFNNFLLSLRSTSQEIWAYVTELNKTTEEELILQRKFEIRVPKVDRKKRRKSEDEDYDFDTLAEEF